MGVLLHNQRGSGMKTRQPHPSDPAAASTPTQNHLFTVAATDAFSLINMPLFRSFPSFRLGISLHNMPAVSRGAPGLFLLHLIYGKRHRSDVLKLRRSRIHV